MYYSSGNYEAFARPRKPARADQVTATIVGAGLAGLAAAAFLVRDGQVPGDKITILEASDLAGGALDGINDPAKGFKVRGGREMEDHFECLWDLYRSVPSLETADASVLDEFYWLNKDDPNYSLMRSTEHQGQDGHADGKFRLTKKAQKDLVKLFLSRDEDLYDKRITDVLGRDFLDSTFWMYWRTMFAFEEWHSALEMKLYLQRFVHHIGGLPDFSALKFTKYNQYESLTLPLVAYLDRAGVRFVYNTAVTDVRFEIAGGRKVARRLDWVQNGTPGGLDLGDDDLVFVTNGSLVENSTWGDHHTAPAFDPVIREGGSWDLWRKIAKQDPNFGRPEKFCGHVEETTWESASLTTLDDRVLPYIEKVCQRDPLSGRVVTGGIVTVQDSSWLMSWTINRQPHFASQPATSAVVWIYGLFMDAPGDYVRKPMRDCTGEEIAREWLFHLGVPVEQIDELAASSVVCLPCMMPFVTSFFEPRRAGDRPDVVPAGVVNFAFLGQFAETSRDCIFTTEYSVRTAMEAVYRLLDVERGVPEVFGSAYDVRTLIKATVRSRDGAKLPIPKLLQKKLDKTVVGDLLRRYEAV
ncbi:oleate hydratase [Propioniciclava tarda]|uniref:Oleate hydratase n=1 Tax=Propioniciclava tarda TaxID=433330 RepID=A0A4V2JTG8_PROTD|nr:oleate hydratase [Propioniciclava tarda]TBT96241.1 oleate hydratase [Propioniciclava tarda]SMO34151.1 oleate hydratase [Propioniciclava tarda]HOA89137.1 oleate hydratase [Propioniciclava tarda]HQA30112.1 oleate hydratase [Propioniciclava tarda]HQD60005.1 oleate hydratase [Propioniciclava tarda]